MNYDSNQLSLGLFKSLRNIVKDKDLIILLVSKDLKSRYRRSFLGLIWTLLNPLLFSLVIWVVFVSIFKANLGNGTQYGPYVLAGVLLITFFNQGVIQSAESISNSGGLFLKFKIDAMYIVIANVLSNFVNFLFGLLALVIVTFLSNAKFTFWAPLAVLLGILFSLMVCGIGLVLGNLFVRFNDLKNIVTILLQVLTYLTPIFYPKEMLQGEVLILVNLNPLTSYLDVFRSTFNGTEIATFSDWIYVVLSAFTIFFFGFYLFRKMWTKTLVMM